MECLYKNTFSPDLGILEEEEYKHYKGKRWWMTPWKQYRSEISVLTDAWKNWLSIAVNTRPVWVQTMLDHRTGVEKWAWNPTYGPKVICNWSTDKGKIWLLYWSVTCNIRDTAGHEQRPRRFTSQKVTWW